MASFNKSNSLLLSWGTSIRNAEHSSNLSDREIYMATNKLLGHEDIMRSSYMFDNPEARRRKKWKEVRHIHMIMSQPQYRHGNIENALWFYGDKSIDVHQFIAAIVNEFQFEHLLHMDKHLKYFFWACEGGVKDQVDWREIVGSFKIFAYYKLIKYKPTELLVHMFDIYALGNGRVNDNPNDTWYCTKPIKTLEKIFLMPCEDTGDIAITTEYVTEFYAAFVAKVQMESKNKQHLHAEKEFEERFTRSNFKQFLKHCPKLVNLYSKMCWARISTELRLESLDFEQTTSLSMIDDYLDKYLVTQAVRMYKKNLKMFQFRQWKIIMLIGRRIRQHEIRKYVRLRKGYFRHWRKDARKSVMKRKRRLLAEVIGNYSLVSRMFARIRLYNYNVRRITATVGSFNPSAARYKLVFFHVREFNRKRKLRAYFYRWWTEIKYMIDWDMAVDHDWRRRLYKLVVPWREHAHYNVMEKRNELMVYENKNKFDKMMENVVVDVNILTKLEKERDDRIEEAKRKKRVEDREMQLEASKKRVTQMKEADRVLVLKMQRDVRRKRIKKDMKAIKTKFDKKWDGIRDEMVFKATKNMKEYVAHKDNIPAMKYKLEKLKKEFFQPPAPELQERERILTSPKNLVFIYLDAKLKNEKLDLKHVITKFDKTGRGDLTHDEFTACIKSLKIKELNIALIGEVIKGVDADNDGFISLEELQSSMKDIESPYMGVKGSPWKMYVDVANDVICYHNFQTTEKIYEYNMTDIKLDEILRTNMICEAEYNALEKWQKEKVEAWTLLLENKMAKRMQYLYRQWKARKERKNKMWIINAQVSNSIRVAQTKVVYWIESFIKGFEARKLFSKQLLMTYEKCWDIKSGRLFYLNHHLKTSVWERPKLLWRYGDVTMPCPWVPFEAPVNNANNQDSSLQMFKIHYWHAKAKRELPKKPDGYPLCSHCQRNLSLRRCLDCQQEFCGKCVWETHGSISAFRQNDQHSLEQLRNKKFIERMKKFDHCFTKSEPLTCQACKTDKMFAGIYCGHCKLNLCKPCSRRIHEQKAQGKHEMWEI